MSLERVQWRTSLPIWAILLVTICSPSSADPSKDLLPFDLHLHLMSFSSFALLPLLKFKYQMYVQLDLKAFQGTLPCIIIILVIWIPTQLCLITFIELYVPPLLLLFQLQFISSLFNLILYTWPNSRNGRRMKNTTENNLKNMNPSWSQEIKRDLSYISSRTIITIFHCSNYVYMDCWNSPLEPNMKIWIFKDFILNGCRQVFRLRLWRIQLLTATETKDPTVATRKIQSLIWSLPITSLKYQHRSSQVNQSFS